MINAIILSGRLVNDPEQLSSNVGRVYTKFRIAFDCYDKSGFINCVAFQKTGEFVARLTKGTPIVINGVLKEENYKDKNGVTQKNYSVIVNQFHTQSKSSSYSNNNNNNGGEEKSIALEDDDLPF